jgi:hypothetical protein
VANQSSTAPSGFSKAGSMGSSNSISPWPGPSKASVATPRRRNNRVNVWNSSLVESSPAISTTTGGLLTPAGIRR